MPEILKLPIPQGLRPEEDMIYDLQYLNKCQNLYLKKNGVFEAEKFTRTTYTDYNLDGISAQAFKVTSSAFTGGEGSLVVTLETVSTEALYSLTDSATLVLKASAIPKADRAELWSCACFGKYIIVGRRSQVLARNITTGAYAINNSLYPKSTDICAHRGRLILASPEGAPYTDSGLRTNIVAWSKVNELTFQETGTPDISNQSGWMLMEHPGIMRRVEPLKQHIIVYGENGISALTLAGSRGYGQTTIHPLGILDAGAVCVNDFADGTTVHYFIDTIGDLYMIDASLSLTKLGYKEHFAADYVSSPGLVMMSYHKRRNELFINFYDSDKTYIYSPYGLTYVEDDIEQIWDYRHYNTSSVQQLVHSPDAISQSDIVYETNIIDMDYEGQKYLWGFTARITCPEAVSVVIDYRTTRTGAWTSSPTMTFDKAMGYLNVGRLSGVEFKIKITVAAYTTFQMSDIVVKYSKINGGAF